MLLVLLTGYAMVSTQIHAVAQPAEARARDRPAAQLKTCCQKITHDIQRIYYLNNRSGKVRLVVRGIYTRGKSLFFSLRLINRSPLDYDVDSIRFFVAKRGKGLHSLQRLKELAPVYVYDSLSSVTGHSRSETVYVLPRITLARQYRLQIEVLEKNGGRHLQVRASNFTLETAKLI